MTNRAMLTLTLAVCLTTATIMTSGRERAWQTGTWRELHVARPKVVFGIGGNPVGGGAGPLSTPPMMEVRTYVIETDELRLELKENIRADARQIDARIGEPVTFALEKTTVYVKQAGGIEHKLSVTRRTPRTES